MKITINNPSNRNRGFSPRVALYARANTQRQPESIFANSDSQLEELTAHAIREGWEVIASIKDEGYSGGSLRRPGLTQIRQMAQDGAIDLVVSSSRDRLTRNASDFYEVSEEFKWHNVEFKTLYDLHDSSAASGRFIELVLSAARNFEREQSHGSL